MCRCLAAFAILAPLFVLAADPPADKDKDSKQPALRVGANVPGPFHPYNVTGKFGPRKEKNKVTGKVEDVEGNYHCPITEHAEDPMVLVFTRDVEVGDKLKSLLQKLDVATAKNTNLRMAATIVFIDKNDPKPDKDTLKLLGDQNGDKAELAAAITAEDRMRELAAELRTKFTGMFTELNPFTKQNLVVVCIGSNAELTKQGYGLDQTHKITVVLFNKLEIRAVHDYEDLDDAKIDAIMTDVADKLGAKRK